MKHEHLPPVPPRLDADGHAHHDGISYALPQGYRPVLLDLHVPAGPGPHPVAVYIHGGGFVSGDRRYLPDTLVPGAVVDAALAAGLALATIDYRLAREARFPAQLDDTEQALAYLRHYAAELRLDPGRFALWGESAGGTLAALAGLRPGAVGAVVCWYPWIDLAGMDPHGRGTIEELLFGAPPAECPELAASATAWNLITADSPPALFVHGTEDALVPFGQSEETHRRLLAAGARSELHAVPGADHCFRGWDDVPGLVAASVRFIVRELRGE